MRVEAAFDRRLNHEKNAHPTHQSVVAVQAVFPKRLFVTIHRLFIFHSIFTGVEKRKKRKKIHNTPFLSVSTVLPSVAAPAGRARLEAPAKALLAVAAALAAAAAA